MRFPVPEATFWSGLRTRLQAPTLAFDENHAAQLASLPLHHRDPFDRMLVAQCLAEDLAFATTDSALAVYKVKLVG